MKFLFAALIALSSASAFAEGTTCEDAYRNAKSSPSIGDVIAAADDCSLSAEYLCGAAVGDMAGTGDGRYIGALCGLEAAKGAHVAILDSRVLTKCLWQSSKAKQSPSTGDVMEATATCEAAVEEQCAGDKEDRSGDARYMQAMCVLEAKHGAFEAAKRFPSK